jgi:hypothetical protein
VATKTIKAIHDTARLSNQSATIDFSCVASVVTEGELVEVGLKVLVAHRAGMRADEQ